MKFLMQFKQYFPFLAWIPMLDKPTIHKDIVAGITAGVLILPQAIALATLAGMPPEYGLYTAIFPVIIVGFFGSSWLSLSGPNTALAVLTAMTIAPFANIGTVDYVQYAITLTFMAGVVQLAFGLTRLGVVFNYFSHTVMVALVTGVGIIIVVQQVGNFMGVVMNLNEDLIDVLQQIWFAVGRMNPYSVAVGVVTIVTGLIVKKWRPKYPHYIIAVITGMAVTQLINLVIGSGIAKVDMLGYMGFSALPLSAPDFSPETFSEFASFAYPAALGMAVLGLMQSAVIARSMAAKSGQPGLDMNQEVIGQGLSNIAGSFLSCFVSSGSFNRSAANLEAGARTPLAGLVSAVALALLVYAASPVIAWLPIPVMAAVLFLVGAALVKPSEIKHMIATKGGGRIVFIAVLLTTVLSGVDDGVYLGIVLSIAGYLRGMSKPEVEVLFDNIKESYMVGSMKAETTTGISISGSLFFASTPYLEKDLANIAREDGRKKDLVMLCIYINGLDTSGAAALAQEAVQRQKNGHKAVLWVREDHLKDPAVAVILKQAFGEDGVICCNHREEINVEKVQHEA